MPYHELVWYPGTPDSAMVGSSGARESRLLPETPRARSFPAFTCGRMATTLLNMISTCPPTRSVSAGESPL